MPCGIGENVESTYSANYNANLRHYGETCKFFLIFFMTCDEYSFSDSDANGEEVEAAVGDGCCHFCCKSAEGGSGGANIVDDDKPLALQ